MNIKKLLKNNIKLYIIMGAIILLGTLGITFALTTSTFNPIAVNTSATELDAKVTYNAGTNSSVITTTGGEVLPILDSIIERDGENTTDTRVIKAEFNVAGLSTNPVNTIYDIALYANNEKGLPCELRTEDLKWRLYKNGSLISSGNLSPTFDVMDNNRLVLTNTQQDLTITPDKYTFLLWISESCTGNITTCDPLLEQNKYLNKEIDISLKIELATKRKKELKRVTSEEFSCEYPSIDIPACNTLTYNNSNHTLINTSDYYTVKYDVGNESGTYTSILTLKDGYKWSDETTGDKILTCEIKRKDLTITTKSKTVTYGTSISLSPTDVTVDGLLPGHTLSDILITSNKSTIGIQIIASNAVIKDQNENDVTNNYNISYINTGTLTVNCLNSATLPEATEHTYTGKTIIGITGGENVEITGITSAVKPGTYTVTVIPKNNYCWTDGTNTPQTKTWSIVEEEAVPISLDNGVTTSNGTSTIYNKAGTYYSNSTYTKEMTTTSNPIATPIKVGYTFDGYYTEENGNGTQMIDSNGYATEALLNYGQTSAIALNNHNNVKATLLNTVVTQIDTKNPSNQILKLYANWKQRTYTISYNANGGTGAPSSQTKLHAKTLTLSSIEPTKNGEQFLGWSTNKNATTPTYLPGDSIRINSNITLYAIWPTYQEFTITKENRHMIGYTDTTTELNIPSTFQAEDGTWYKVTSISNNAFQFCNNLTNITIPESVISIKEYAFANCNNLTSINIPNGVTTIENSAFWNCIRVTNITIPESVTSIEIYAFSGMYNLESITVDENNNNYITVNDVLYNKEMDTLILYPSKKVDNTFNIPEGITIISDYAFYNCSNLTNITIPESVTAIRANAFDNCKNLTSINIPNGVTTIGREAFYGCSNLTNITIPESVTSIGTNALAVMYNLESITVDEYNTNYTSFDGVLYSIERKALILYPAKKEDNTFNIPEGVTTISDYSFYNCDNLINITIPNSITSIGYKAFDFSNNLTDIYYTGTEANWNAITIGTNNTPLINATKHYNHVIS